MREIPSNLNKLNIQQDTNTWRWSHLSRALDRLTVPLGSKTSPPPGPVLDKHTSFDYDSIYSELKHTGSAVSRKPFPFGKLLKKKREEDYKPLAFLMKQCMFILPSLIG